MRAAPGALGAAFAWRNDMVRLFSTRRFFFGYTGFDGTLQLLFQAKGHWSQREPALS